MTPDARPGIPPQDPEPSPPRHTLIVENNPATADMLRNVIRQVLPQTALHLAGSLALARRVLVGAHPDLAVIDLNVADIPLRDFIAETAERQPRTLVIVVAGHGGDDRILPALRVGAAGVLLKHDPPSVIEYQLRDALSGVLPLSPSLAHQLIRHLDSTGLAASLVGSELELLTWVAFGDTLAQATRRMRTDRDAVLSHIRGIYQKLKLRAGSGEAPTHGVL